MLNTRIQNYTSCEVSLNNTCLNIDNFEFVPKNEFEIIVKQLILKYIPKDFFKIYSVKFPNCSHFIGNDIWKDARWSFILALLSENNTKIISSQHGSGYGQWHSFPRSKIEYKINDAFIDLVFPTMKLSSLFHSKAK